MHHFPHELEREVGGDADGDPGVRPREGLNDDAIVLEHETQADHVIELRMVGEVLLAHQLVAVQQDQVVAHAVGLRRVLHAHHGNRRQDGAARDAVVREKAVQEVNGLVYHRAG